MYYHEYPPHPALAAHLDCVWAARAPGGGQGYRVLPDNCVDILWQDGGRPGFAVGMMSTAILVASAAPAHTLAVRFKPGAAARFLAQPLHALTDQRVDLDLLWGSADAERLAEALWTGRASDRARLARIERALLHRLHHAGNPLDNAAENPAGDALVRQALRLLDASDGGLRIDALALQLGLSRQHLAALFRARVGLSPKLYARVRRFRRATQTLRSAAGAAPDWAALALDCGYFDQSHLIHDFQQFAGLAPQRFHFSNPAPA